MGRVWSCLVCCESLSTYYVLVRVRYEPLQAEDERILAEQNQMIWIQGYILIKFIRKKHLNLLCDHLNSVNSKMMILSLNLTVSGNFIILKI